MRLLRGNWRPNRSGARRCAFWRQFRRLIWMKIFEGGRRITSHQTLLRFNIHDLARKRVFYVALACSALLPVASHSEQKFQATWPSLRTHRVPAWFDNAKFGIFIHWGPYSV